MYKKKIMIMIINNTEQNVNKEKRVNKKIKTKKDRPV